MQAAFKYLQTVIIDFPWESCKYLSLRISPISSPLLSLSFIYISVCPPGWHNDTQFCLQQDDCVGMMPTPPTDNSEENSHILFSLLFWLRVSQFLRVARSSALVGDLSLAAPCTLQLCSPAGKNKEKNGLVAQHNIISRMNLEVNSIVNH